MAQQSSQKPEVEEITFAGLSIIVKAELQQNPISNCNDISKKYGISVVYQFEIYHIGTIGT